MGTNVRCLLKETKKEGKTSTPKIIVGDLAGGTHLSLSSL